MSSFEPDPRFGTPSFRPLTPGLAADAGFVSGVGRSAWSGPTAAAGGNAAQPACTAEQHAELERRAFEDGVARAQADQARTERACESLEAAAAELGRVSLRVLFESREAIVELAAEIARRCLADELRLDPARYAAPIERALAECVDATAATIFLAPEVLATLETTLPDWTERWSGKQPVAFTADPALEAGGFRIETATRSLDAGLEGLVPRLREALAAAFEAPAPAAGSESGAC